MPLPALCFNPLETSPFHVGTQVVAVLQQLWHVALPRPSLLQELLLLCSNLLHACPEAVAAFSQTFGQSTSLLQLLLDVLLDSRTELGVLAAVAGVVLGYSSSEEGGRVLANQEGFLSFVEKLVGGCLVRKEWSKLATYMQVRKNTRILYSKVIRRGSADIGSAFLVVLNESDSHLMRIPELD